MRDVQWASWTSPLGLPVAGALPKMSDGADVGGAHLAPGGALLATCDDFRKVNLFRFPCAPAAACRSVAAHAAHVPLVRFTADGAHLLSVGGPDLCVMVWRVERREAEFRAEVYPSDDASDAAPGC